MTLDWSVLWIYRAQLLRGAGMTAVLAVTTMALALPFGLVLAFLRLSGVRLIRAPATAFVEVFRSTPLLLQIYWAYYVLPAVLRVTLPGLTTALIGLVCNVASYNSETFRAGILSIRQGQSNAALGLGMSRAQAMRYVVLPQAARRVLPALATTWVALFKDTSLVSIISVHELSYEASEIRAETFRVIVTLIGLAALYWLMGYPQAKLVDWIHRRWKTDE